MTGNWRWAGTAGAFSLVLLTGVLLGPPSATAAARASSASATTVLSSDPRIGFVGRWERHYSGNEAATVNSGSQIRLTFTGRQLTGLFDISPVRMAFFGDSITEGIRALGQPLTPDGADGTRTYASVAGRAFHADIQLVGFGKQGVMRDGVGNVPTAPESFPYNFQGSAADPRFRPDIVVLLQGSNDSTVTDEQFAPAYASYLSEVRAANPHAWIFAMEPLIGRHSAVIQSDVAHAADPRMVFVNTDGWLDRHSTADYTDTVHPTVAGHLKVASRLIPIISRVTGLPVRSSPVRVAVPDVTPAQGGTGLLTAGVNIEQVLPEARHAASGTVLVTAPPDFTVDRSRLRYRVGRDGIVMVTVRLPIRPGTRSPGDARRSRHQRC
jgi:lysophospholipase L1-like esterase